MSAGRTKSVSRRHLLTLVGGAAGVLATRHATAGQTGASHLKDAHARDAHAKASTPVDGRPKAAGVWVEGKAPPPSVGTPAVTGVASPSLPSGAYVEGAPAASLPSGEWVNPEALPAGPQFRKLAVPAAPTPLLQLFGGLTPGGRLGRWTVESIHQVHLGAIPVVLRTPTGTRFQVDVLRRDTAEGAPQGVANTRGFSVFLANNGRGQSTTSEEQGLGAMALGAWISRHEGRASAPSLLTLRQRAARFPGAGFGVLS